MDYNTNHILIEGLRDGSDTAYAFLMNKFYRRLYAYALTLIDDRALAQDIVQSVFLRTWEFRKKLNPEYSLQSFLYKSVYNEFINTYKKNKAVTLLEQKYLEALSETTQQLDEARLKRVLAIVTAEIKNLPPKCRKVFTLSKKEGLTNQEISEYLNISVKTVESQITKAFTILKKKLGNRYETILFLLLNEKFRFQ